MNILYTVDRRADTGVTNVTMGIWLFLASEVMLFGALFSAYALLRISAPAWPSGRDVLSLPHGITNTILLVIMTAMAWRARAGSLPAARRALLVSSIFAVAFLGVKIHEYAGEVQHGQLPAVSTFLATYFTLTGLHVLHVVCGLVANGWALTGVVRVGDAMTLGRFRALSLY